MHAVTKTQSVPFLDLSAQYKSLESEWLAAIRETDGMAWDVWKLLQSDPFYRGQTAFFITNDHGRHPDGHLDGFISHGCSCEGCRRILLFAVGPDFKKGVVIEKKREQIDLAVTAAKILGFSIPGSKGRVMTELFIRP